MEARVPRLRRWADAHLATLRSLPAPPRVSAGRVVTAEIAASREVTILTGHTGGVLSVAWATTGEGRLLLATASDEGSARVWDPHTGTTLTTLTGHTGGVLSVAWATTGDGRLLLATRNAAATHVHADETTWRVYEQVEDSTGHKWWLWVFIADDTIVFRMDPTRSNSVLDTHFGITEDDRAAGALPDGRRLVLSSDFFVVYQSLARLDGVDALWCWAHIRRYFVRAGDANAYLGPWRDAWIARIADLYVAHKAMAAAEPGSDGHATATTAFEQALTVIDTVRQQQATGPNLHPAAAKVLATLDREWDGLARHRDFPDAALDNNVSERALRTPVVGRKNYYGSHAEWSAHLAARVWTITATAERHGLQPLTYLTDYLTACAQAGGKPPEGPDLDQFLPWLPGPIGSRDHDPPTINPSG